MVARWASPARAGPGVAEVGAIGLAVMTELPLIVITQRGGSSTGLPIKTEQVDASVVLSAG